MNLFLFLTIIFIFYHYYCLLYIELSFGCCDIHITPFVGLIKELWFWLDHLLYILLSYALLYKSRKCFSFIKGNSAFIWLPDAKSWGESQRTRNEVAEQDFVLIVCPLATEIAYCVFKIIIVAISRMYYIRRLLLVIMIQHFVMRLLNRWRYQPACP